MVRSDTEGEKRPGGRLRGLPLPVLLTLGLLLVIGSGYGGFQAYRAWDYVEHDNDFCFSCHLMQEPFERFAQSAHRGLGCKACHQPNMVERSQMGITGVVFDPDSISVHAEVPNDLCADCHVNGDPEQWRIVAASAGHRVHFESTDPALEGLQCVECHSSGLHEFAATDQTCAQSGCHTESSIALGAMSDLTIHCAACHGFSTPVTEAETEAAMAALAPNQDTCLTCHAMRALVEMPDPDPHEASCASCHNPHEQATPAEAAASCTSSQCHSDPDALTPFHRGLPEPVSVDCVLCHQAHDFSLDGDDCASCHVDVGGGAGGPSAGPDGAATFVGAVGASLLPAQELAFDHAEHASVDCASCHDSAERHGAITVTTVADCRSCHHAATAPTADGCAACHENAEPAEALIHVTRDLDLSVGAVSGRALDFEHDAHTSVDCASCHTDGLALSAEAVDCASCHVEHHEPEVACIACHVTQAADPHRIETAHVTCAGAACHQDVPFEGLPRTRDVCLVCHQDQVDHRPGGDCAECHAMPDIGGG